jgi:hypothetical protein
VNVVENKEHKWVSSQVVVCCGLRQGGVCLGGSVHRYVSSTRVKLVVVTEKGVEKDSGEMGKVCVCACVCVCVCVRMCG